MKASSLWLAIGALATGTWLLRYSFIGLLRGRPLPASLARAVALSVSALLAAMVATLLLPAQSGPFVTRLPHLLAAIVSGVWAHQRGGLLIPMVLGFAVLHLARQLL